MTNNKPNHDAWIDHPKIPFAVIRGAVGYVKDKVTRPMTTAQKTPNSTKKLLTTLRRARTTEDIHRAKIALALDTENGRVTRQRRRHAQRLLVKLQKPTPAEVHRDAMEAKKVKANAKVE